MSHTPTPWTNDGKYVQWATGLPIAKFVDELHAVTAVRCVNSHDKLVAAVKKYREICDYVCQVHPEDCNCSKCDELAEVDEALKAAGVVGNEQHENTKGT